MCGRMNVLKPVDHCKLTMSERSLTVGLTDLPEEILVEIIR
jgi:hypothetical protein